MYIVGKIKFISTSFRNR